MPVCQQLCYLMCRLCHINHQKFKKIKCKLKLCHLFICVLSFIYCLEKPSTQHFMLVRLSHLNGSECLTIKCSFIIISQRHQLCFHSDKNKNWKTSIHCLPVKWCNHVHREVGKSFSVRCCKLFSNLPLEFRRSFDLFLSLRRFLSKLNF